MCVCERERERENVCEGERKRERGGQVSFCTRYSDREVVRYFYQ